MTEEAGHLSQSEIDALLASLSSPAQENTPPTPAPEPSAELRKIKIYDFRRPDVFSKEQMRALRLIYENWARRISVSLTSYLRGSVEVNLADIDQGMYVSLAQQLGINGLYHVIGLGVLPGRFLLHMSSDLCMRILDRIMGGPGTGNTAQRELTDMEMSLLRVISERMIIDLKEAWSGTIVLNPRIDDTSLNLMLVPIALPADAVVSVTFEVRVRGVASHMTIAMPYPVLKPIAGRLNPYNTWVGAEPIKTEDGDLQRASIQLTLETVTLPITIQLGRTTLSVEEMISLEAGDILCLGTPANALCPMCVNGRPKFLVRPGIRRRKMAVRIEEFIEEPELPTSLLNTTSLLAPSTHRSLSPEEEPFATAAQETP